MGTTSHQVCTWWPQMGHWHLVHSQVFCACCMSVFKLRALTFVMIEVLIKLCNISSRLYKLDTSYKKLYFSDTLKVLTQVCTSILKQIFDNSGQWPHPGPCIYSCAGMLCKHTNAYGSIYENYNGLLLCGPIIAINIPLVHFRIIQIFGLTSMRQLPSFHQKIVQSCQIWKSIIKSMDFIAEKHSSDSVSTRLPKFPYLILVLSSTV